MSSFNLSEILQYIPEDDTLDLDVICKYMKEAEKRNILKKHPYKIWNNPKNGRWYTYLKGEGEERVLKSKTSKKALEDLIVDYYQEHIFKPCFPEVYNEWIAEKEEFKEIEASSICRYMNDYKRFFPSNEPFCKIRMCDMDDDIMERFIKKTIVEKHLTVKAYAGLRTLLIGVFKYAKRKKYTIFSIASFFNDISLPKNIFSHNIKNQETEVFSLSELKELETYLWNKKVKSKRDLAVLLQIFTGIRVGELTALKVSDNVKKNYLKISRTEYNYFDKELHKRVTSVKDFPKTENGVRTIVLPVKAQLILDMLKLQAGRDEYLFSENGKRITSKQINYHLRKICTEIDITPRSTHKIRRSYASKLLLDQLDASFVQNQMGHKDITTTQQYYYYDIEEDAEKLAKINKAMTF